MSALVAEVPGRWFLVATFLPLVAFVILLLVGTTRRVWRLPDTFGRSVAGWFAVSLLLLAAGCSVVGLTQFLADPTRPEQWGERTEWMAIGGKLNDTRPAVSITIGYRVDAVSAVMITMVTVVSSCIFLFSMGYMKEERSDEVEDHITHHSRSGRFGRFYLYLCLFAFAMLNILIADNLFQIFIGWELVGVSSYFLIGFYTERPAAGRASLKAFLMNRIGDAGFLVGLAVAWQAVGSFNLDVLGDKFGGLPAETQWWIGFGLLCGCLGKSAQVPLQTWLPDAMEGPTPVSALIHAATMVAAGVYLVGRCFALFPPDVLILLAYLGATTMIVSAVSATVQTDLKKVLAYSTASQLGFMMLGLGLGAWGPALLHLLTHAFFKALLFLCAGSVIHAMHHEQDLAKMGGLRKRMPVTAGCMLIGVLAIVGMPFLSGWYSKDQLLGLMVGSAANDGGQRPVLLVLPFVTAGLTSFYMFRLWLLAFAGEPRAHHAERAHESPVVMLVPLIVLAVFSVGVAWGWPVWHPEASQLGELLHTAEPVIVSNRYEPVIRKAEEYHLLAGGFALAAGVVGLSFAVSKYRTNTLLGSDRRSPGRSSFVDTVYSAVFTRPTVRLAGVAAGWDKASEPEPRSFDFRTLDGWLSSMADVTVWFGGVLRQVQTGRVRTSLLALGLTMAFGLGILVFFTR